MIKDIIKDKYKRTIYLMKSKKDNQLTSSHYSYGDTELDTGIHGPFGKNYACANAYKRTEKLLIAIYLVTNFVPNSEPAKNIIRDKSVKILSDVIQLRLGFNSTGPERLDNVIASVYEIISLLNILHATCFISDMNLEILKKELNRLIVFLREIENTEMSENVMFDKKYFNTEESVKGHTLKDNDMSFNKSVTKTSSQSKRQNNTRKKSTSSSNIERRTVILSLIKDNKSVNVKDISAVITNCSEKTIQRELVALVSEGVLKKEGERRWSTYSLN